MTPDYLRPVLGRDDLNVVQDKWNIQQLVNYERYCRDNGYFEEMAGCYSSSSHVRTTWFDGNGKTFARQSAHSGQGGKHKLYNTLVWVKENRGVAEVSARMVSKRFKVHDVTVELNSLVRIVYWVQREGNGWRIINITVIYERDHLVVIDPDQRLSLDDIDVSQFRDSYRWLSYVLALDGQHSDQDLAGEDRPETVNRVFEATNNWLEKGLRK